MAQPEPSITADTKVPLGAVATLTLTLLGLFGTILVLAWNGGITLSTIQSDTAMIKAGVSDLKAGTSQLDARVRTLEMSEQHTREAYVSIAEFNLFIDRARAAGVNLPSVR